MAGPTSTTSGSPTARFLGSAPALTCKMKQINSGISHLRGCLSGKKSTRASFTKILANYTSEESFLTAVYDKNII